MLLVTDWLPAQQLPLATCHFVFQPCHLLGIFERLGMETFTFGCSSVLSHAWSKILAAGSWRSMAQQEVRPGMFNCLWGCWEGGTLCELLSADFNFYCLAWAFLPTQHLWPIESQVTCTCHHLLSLSTSRAVAMAHTFQFFVPRRPDNDDEMGIAEEYFKLMADVQVETLSSEDRMELHFVSDSVNFPGFEWSLQ